MPFRRARPGSVSKLLREDAVIEASSIHPLCTPRAESQTSMETKTMNNKFIVRSLQLVL